MGRGGDTQMTKAIFCILVAVTMFATEQSFGQEIPEAYLVCAAVDEAEERLACFDRETTRRLLDAQQSVADDAPEADKSTAEKAAASPDPQRTAVTESATAAVPVALPSASSTVSVSPAAESVAAPASTSTAGASRSGSAAAPISTAEDEFGIPVGQKPSRRDDPDEISATVTKVGVQAHGEHVVYLDNGHVWQENFKNRHFPVEPGSVVTIKKRRFGGYNLYNDTGSVFRVKRIR